MASSAIRAFLFRQIYLRHLGSFGFSGRLAHPELRPLSLWPGDGVRGKQIVEKQFLFHNTSVSFTEEGWQVSGNTPPHWFAELYRFGWIMDIMAFSNTRLSAVHVRDYLSHWLEEKEPLDEVAHDLDITGERLTNLCSSLMFVLAGANGRFRRALLRGIARDALRLAQQVRKEHPEAGMAALKGLIAVSLSLPHAGYLLPVALRALPQAMAREMAADGSHASRSPRKQADFLRHLLDLQAMLTRANKDPVSLVDKTIMPVASALRFFLHGDGGLALFNDSLMGDAAQIRRMLTRAGTEKIDYDSIKSGFHRLARGTGTVLLDAGVPNLQAATTHLGTLSFEFSVGTQRVVSNCGAYRGASERWQRVCRTTPAHSTLILNRMDSFPRAPFSLRRVAPVLEATYGERQHCPFVEARYTGYTDAFGIVHQRSLVLSESGDELRGVDLLYTADEKTASHAHQVEIRFHLHPAVKVVALDSGSAELMLPNRDRWVFSSTWPVKIEESVYLGEDGLPKPSRQLYLSRSLTGVETAVEWMFQRQPDALNRLL